MIILVLCDEIDEKTKQKTGKQIVSHGVDINTMENVVLPSDYPERLGVFHRDLQEWVAR